MAGITKEWLTERLERTKRSLERQRRMMSEDVGYTKAGSYHLAGQLHRLTQLLAEEELLKEMLYEIDPTTEDAEPEGDRTPPTYHGIMKAECLTCGFTSTDRVELEMWNDLGLACPACNRTEGSTKWLVRQTIVRTTHMGSDGTVTVTDEKGDADG